MTMRRFIRNTVLFSVLCLAGQMIMSLEYSVDRDLHTGKAQGIRVTIPEPYKAGPEVMSIQQHQKTHPTLGFLWKPDIGTDNEVIVGWGDIPAGAIATDDIGFANDAQAVARRRAGTPIDIVGVGASYMGGAQAVFHEYLELEGMFYYSMAHGRFTLPQYNIAMRDYALPEKPRWIIYGLNEVSFTLIPDFEEWEKSGMDWFTYHSGTWCGPAYKTGFPHDQLRAYPRVYKVYLSMMKKMFRPEAGGSVSRGELVDKTLFYILDAWRMAREQNAGFILLLIPSRVRMVQGPSPSLYLFEQLVPRLEKEMVPFIDLRHTFAREDDPQNLYFTYDAHWNRMGVYRAVREILDYMKAHEEENRDVE